MKLDYKIIWVDDKIDNAPYKTLIKNIQGHVNEQFFNCPIIEIAEDFEEFKAKFNNKTQYDLIITDLSLNNGSTGKEVIDFVRDNQHNHTEIFFYSANTQFRKTELINSNRITFYQLVSENSYKDLENEVKELIDLTIRKFQHIVAMRGMIMQETSSIDADMLEIVTNYIAKTNSAEVKNRVYDELISFHSRKLSDSEKFKKNDNINNILKDPLLISSTQRANAIEEIIKLIGIDNFIEDLKSNIIKVRNDFAHAVYIKDEKTGREYFQDKKGGIDFNEEKCKEIRFNIIKHKNNINILKSKL